MEKRKRKKILTEEQKRAKLLQEGYTEEEINHRIHMEKELKRVNIRYVWKGKNKNDSNIDDESIIEEALWDFKDEEPQDEEARIMKNLSDGRGDLEGY